MSISLSRRDAVKGLMAAGAAIATMPLLANLTGSGASSAQVAPMTAATSSAGTSATSATSTIARDGETLVLVIRNDVISGFKGLQKVKLQDAGLASSFKSAFVGRFE
ncbi:MAG: hypothetical protein OK456_02745 [Thaumarchaeota archaeon]|nr:hypothetical protein [Nitrososphaerota archaeon]